MKLINVSNDFSVESLKLGNRTVEFVHNKNTGYNYFNQKVLSDLFGINQNTVSKHLNKYLGDSSIFTTNSSKIRIRLQTSNKGRKTSFYGFDAVTYLAFRINTPEAINCHEILANKRALHKRADEVINTIEPRTDGSEQLKLI